jgi:hypothetical protein
MVQEFVKLVLKRYGNCEVLRQILVAEAAKHNEDEFVSRRKLSRLRKFNRHMGTIGMPHLKFIFYEPTALLLHTPAADDLASRILLGGSVVAIKRVVLSYVRLQTDEILFGELLDPQSIDVMLLKSVLNAVSLEKYRLVTKLRSTWRANLINTFAQHAGEIARTGRFFGLALPTEDIVASLTKLFLDPAWVHVFGPRDYSDSYSCVWTRDVASGQFVPQVVCGTLDTLRRYPEWKGCTPDQFHIRALDGGPAEKPYIVGVDNGEEILHVLHLPDLNE